MDEYKQLVDLDGFFYYGESDLSFENKSDLMELLLQPKNSLYYFRDFGGGISEFENYPQGFGLDIGLRFEVAMAVARRNISVTDGSNNTKDRRIAASQTSVNIQQRSTGEIDVQVLYFNFFDYQNPVNILVPIGRV